MRVLALEPYDGGSHQAFLRGWSNHSRHAWTILGLRPHHWKWRMRHAAVTLAGQVAERAGQGEQWDVVVCSDMLNLAEFRGLTARLGVGQLPAVAYFHENQLTYPVREPAERDHHFAMTNFTTAVSADRVWFNSAFHRGAFLTAVRDLLGRMPDYQPLGEVDQIANGSEVFPPGIEWPPPRGERRPGPLRILWAARWEHDKNPDAFFAAAQQLESAGVAYRLSVIGEQFREAPPIFASAREALRHRIDRWGFQESREEYLAALQDADVFVSTANHEFFGVSVVEAIAAGAYPLLPKRLAYPELLAVDRDPQAGTSFLYDGNSAALAERLSKLARRLAHDQLWEGDPNRGRHIVQRFAWGRRVPLMDNALERLA